MSEPCVWLLVGALLVLVGGVGLFGLIAYAICKVAKNADKKAGGEDE